MDDRIRVATGDQDNVMIASDAKKSVVVLPSFHNLGGTFRRPEDKIVAAVGMGANPTGVVIAKTSIGTSVKAKGPGFTLEECDSTEKLKNLKGETKGKGTHHGSNIFLLAPWAVKNSE